MEKDERTGAAAVIASALIVLALLAAVVLWLTGCAIAIGDRSTATVTAPVSAPVDVDAAAGRPGEAKAGPSRDYRR